MPGTRPTKSQKQGPIPTRKRLPRAERRRAIVDAAARRFARDGYHLASMASLAQEAGITPPILYDHFPSKRELYLAVLREQARALAAGVGNATDPASATLEQRILQTARAFVDFVHARPYAWVLIRTVPAGDPVIVAAHRKLRERARASVSETTARDPDFSAPPDMSRNDAAALMGQLQWVAYEGLGDWAHEHPEAEPEQLMAIFMDFMWIGLERLRRGQHWRS